MITFFFTKSFRLHKGNILAIEFQSISLFHISNDNKKFEYHLLSEILNRHETENNSVLMKAYFSNFTKTEHLFYNILEEELLEKFVFDAAIEKGIYTSI